MTVNLRPVTVRGAVLDLVADELEQLGLTIATSTLRELLVHHAVNELHAAGDLQYFRDAHTLNSVSRLAARSIQDFRLSGLTAADARSGG